MYKISFIAKENLIIMSKEVLAVWNNVNEQLTNFVYGKVKDFDLSRDIVQDVFLKVFSKIDTLKNREKLVSWIYQITRNEIGSHFRKNKLNVFPKDINEQGLDSNLTLEVSQCLHPLINSLPEKYREALILADIEKIPQKEIAQRLNISYSGAKSRVQRSREMLKSVIEECCIITTDVYGDVLDYKVKKFGREKLKGYDIGSD